MAERETEGHMPFPKGISVRQTQITRLGFEIGSENLFSVSTVILPRHFKRLILTVWQFVSHFMTLKDWGIVFIFTCFLSVFFIFFRIGVILDSYIWCLKEFLTGSTTLQFTVGVMAIKKFSIQNKYSKPWALL